MWTSIFRFEIGYHLRQPFFYLVTAFLALNAFFLVTTEAASIFGAAGQVHMNSPFVILRLLTALTFIGLFVVTAFVSSSAERDFAHGTHELFFSKPVKKRDYLFGRFAGSMVVTVLVYAGMAFGIVIGGFMPWIDPERVGPFMLAPYVWTLLVMVLPNLFFLGAVFYAVTLWTRSLLATYLGVVVFFVAYSISDTLLGDIDNQELAALFDPFGQASLSFATKYWTVAEKNSAIPELAGNLLMNRLLWVGLGIAMLSVCYMTFHYSRAARRAAKKRLARERVAEAAAAVTATVAALPRIRPAFGRSVAWRQFSYQIRHEALAILRGIPFIVILAFGIWNVVMNATFVDQMFGTSVHPVTHLMLNAVQGLFFLLVIIITFYSGDMIWRERSLKLDGVYDALPVPNGVYMGGKVVALLLVSLIFGIAGILATIGFQLYRGHTQLELELYAKGYVLGIIPFIPLCFLAVFFQILPRSKFLGFALMIAALLLPDVLLNPLDMQHNLYRFGEATGRPYSDMNGYGHFLPGYFSFHIYWIFFALILLAFSILFWKRGSDMVWATRVKLARERFRGPVRVLLAVGVTGFVATGAFIFYNTNVLNEYVPTDLGEERQAEYEKKYRQYRHVPLPRITAVQADVDIFPSERRVEIRGTYQMKNETDAPITELHLGVPQAVEFRSLELPAHETRLADDKLGYYIYDLAEPLAPGAEMEMSFEVAVLNRGFRNHGSNVNVVDNGTFFNNREYFPIPGYSEAGQLVDRNDRRKHGLEPVQRLAKIDDVEARGHTFLGRDADWVDFEATVSTAADQIAIAPGYLQKEWTEGNRRYFHYKMDAPILHFFSFLSARYEVLRDTWNDVTIEIYYHPGHEYNLERMVDSTKKSLDYFSTNFSPYQHRQVRIIEFPRYRTFAQSFPNTIPFSESIGFIARLDEDDPEAVDYPFYVTAHEVAHQWWGHQVSGGFVQGVTMLVESMSQYAALMVMEDEYGPEKMRRFLKLELDQYLRSRGSELIEEMPLQLVENQQYIHYQKGSVVMYALQDHLGEEKLNSALRDYVSEVAFQEPPFTVTLELLDHVSKIVPEDQGHLLEDMFATITLFENEVAEATYTEQADGTYLVRLEAKAKKLRADGEGTESEIPIDDWIDIAVFGEEEVDGKTEEKVLFFEKRRVTASEVSFEMVVDEPPVRAGIDPYNKLVDRNSGDNVKRVSKAG